MNRLPIAARFYVWGVCVAGALLLGLVFPRQLDSIPTASAPDGNLIVPIAVLVLFTVTMFASCLVTVRLPRDASVAISTAIIFATAVIFGLGWACWTAAIAEALAQIILRKPWYKAAFNTLGVVLWTGAASWVYLALCDSTRLPLNSLTNVGAMFAYAIVDFAINALLVSLIIGFSNGLRPWQVFQANFQGVTVQYATMIPIGALIATAYAGSAWSVLLVGVPLAVVYYSLRTSQELYRQTIATIEALADYVDRRDPYTFEHSLEVSRYAEKIAQRLDLGLQDLMTLTLAARVHDLGKIAIPDSILLKPGKLTPEEREVMQSHSAIGADMVARLSLYKGGRDLILYHHERYDGKGYPTGIAGDRIPLGARIMAVADSYQAMTSDRPYRKAMPMSAAIAELDRGRGTQFDSRIVDAFIAILREQAPSEPSELTLEHQTA